MVIKLKTAPVFNWDPRCTVLQQGIYNTAAVFLDELKRIPAGWLGLATYRSDIYNPAFAGMKLVIGHGDDPKFFFCYSIVFQFHVIPHIGI